MANFDGTDEFFDSREVIERIAELELLAETMSDDEETEEARAEAYEEYDADEYAALIALQDEAKGYISDWEYGETFISDDYFETYAEELAYDIGQSIEKRRGLSIGSTGQTQPRISRSITRNSSSAERPTTLARSLLSFSPVQR